MKISEKDLIGNLEGFPIEVVEIMLKRQEEQGNVANVMVFQNEIRAGAMAQGFNWVISPEGEDFWKKVVLEKNFELFFEKYPMELDMPNEYFGIKEEVPLREVTMDSLIEELKYRVEDLGMKLRIEMI